MLGVAPLIPAQEGSGHAHGKCEEDRHHRFQDAEAWAERFDDPARDEWQKPEEVLRALSLSADAKVVDIGSGTGYFATRLAAHLTKGTVWGVDIEPDMVLYLRDRARREGFENLFSILGLADDPLLPQPVDLVLVVDTYHHIGDRPAYFGKLREHLRPDGRVAIVDFKKGDLPVGPPDSMKLEPAEVTREFEAAGYRRIAIHDFLPYQYLLVYAPGAPTKPE
jgi:cyclopropane fatty-acyl-phospholipid synthase-like methyltransferase